MALRIATIGRLGQTAQAIAAAAARDASIVLMRAGRDVADLRNGASLARFIDAAKPDVLINAGAYNLVDRAETEEATAFAINADGPRELARLTRARGIHFVHMSTDCVFDGVKPGVIDESDPPNPLSAYGRSKLAGEQAVAEEYPEALTTRVCWVFSEYADNFVSKMIELARTRPVLRVVSDQVGPPTYAPDIAAGLIRIAKDGGGLSGILHLASPDAISRSDMAVAIMAELKAQGGPFADIEPVTTTEFNAPAMRPLNAQLSGERATKLLDLAWTPFAEALRRSVAGIIAR